MGMFSWITSDTKKPITSVHAREGPLPVWMLLPDGTKLHEAAYEGYGEFGGRDFYAVVAQLNIPGITGKDTEIRGHGIGIAFKDSPQGMGGIQPRFVEDGSLKWEDVENSPPDPDQGFGSQEDDDDD